MPPEDAAASGDTVGCHAWGSRRCYGPLVGGGPGMLNILHGIGQPPQINSDLGQNVSRDELEEPHFWGWEESRWKMGQNMGHNKSKGEERAGKRTEGREGT